MYKTHFFVFTSIFLPEYPVRTSDTRVWVDIPGIVMRRDTRYRFGLAMNIVLPVPFIVKVYAVTRQLASVKVAMPCSEAIPTTPSWAGPIPRYRRA